MTIEQLGKPIELILSDVDGVLTDGGIYFDNQGIEIKRFHVRDGQGIKLWQRAGFRFGLLTARSSHLVKVRAAELNIDIVRQGYERKQEAVHELMAQLDLRPEQVCHIGDDLTDLPVIRWAGLGAAVQDAVAEVIQAADYVTEKPGGSGAVREVIESILKAKGRWDDLVRNYAI